MNEAKMTELAQAEDMFLPAFRLVRRAETNNARTFTGTGIVLGCHKVDG